MRGLLLTILILITQVVISQVTVNGAWEKDTVVIGDEVSYTLSIEIGDASEIVAVDARFLDSVYSV